MHQAAVWCCFTAALGISRKPFRISSSLTILRGQNWNDMTLYGPLLTTCRTL